MGILLCEQNFRDVWRRNKSVGQKLVKFCAHTHTHTRAKLVVRMGTTFAVVQSVGIVLCCSEAWKNSVNVGVSTSASALSNFVGMWSGPVDLCSLSVHAILCYCNVLHGWMWAIRLCLVGWKCPRFGRILI